MPLTDTTIRNTKPGAKPSKMSDCGGLYLLLNPNGSRWWRLDYRFSGKRKTLSMGVYPDVSLKDQPSSTIVINRHVPVSARMDSVRQCEM